MKKYLNLRIRYYYGIELLGQKTSDLNWETIQLFKTKNDLIDFVIEFKHELIFDYGTLYDVSYGMDDFMFQTNYDIKRFYLGKEEI